MSLQKSFKISLRRLKPKFSILKDISHCINRGLFLIKKNSTLKLNIALQLSLTQIQTGLACEIIALDLDKLFPLLPPPPKYMHKVNVVDYINDILFQHFFFGLSQLLLCSIWGTDR